MLNGSKKVVVRVPVPVMSPDSSAISTGSVQIILPEPVLCRLQDVPSASHCSPFAETVTVSVPSQLISYGKVPASRIFKPVVPSRRG